jgi:geranylgeranyl pyrophosphate synthase
MSMSGDVAKVLTQWRELVYQELVAFGHSSGGDSKTLQSATTYVLQGHGKRLRALLPLALSSDLTGSGEVSKPPALRVGIALEMLHAASLVHDDLPALDNDDMRRGRPSCHRKFTEATAILTGDFLVGRAFSAVTEGSLSPMQRLRVLTTLAQAWSDLCMGQQVDIDRPTDAEEVQRLMELKTGALFGAATACGAICADCDEDLTSRFRLWGTRVGVLFQRLDDIADGDGTSGTVWNKDREIHDLLVGLRSLHHGPLLYTEGVYRMIIGEQV